MASPVAKPVLRCWITGVAAVSCAITTAVSSVDDFVLSSKALSSINSELAIT
jgi:hypothetical protein